MEQPALTSAPPDLPERPEGVERAPQWPAWFAVAGFAVGITGTLLLVGIGGAILGIDGKGSETPAFVVLATFVQAAVFVATAALFAGFVSRPRPWHFGLRGTRLWRALGWAAGGIVAFYVVTAVYSALVPTDAKQGVTEDLGADDGTLGLIVAGLMVMIVAPVAEEIFFRGFFFRALRSRFTIVGAAAIDGLLFGTIHYSGDGADGLLLLPPLALLGFIFCIVYENTGSLFPVIGMHVFNNAVAFAAQVDGGWQVSLAVAPLVLAACALAPRLLEPRPRAAPA